ncbi:uncharacterized protein LOC135127738 isoform X2 [Zophobas morio]|uniref:uncharacterized protein LOC135127738 isoform X2 n=1 Tax=Zophobas morio TaxID=2755281 RepID=UPI003083042C
MLLDRSIFLQACLLLTLTQCYCQDYETNYDEGEDAQDESGPVDYSKYYAVDTSAPLVANQDFGASIKQEVAQPKNPFAAQTKTFGFAVNQQQFPDFSQSGHFPIDYFEQAQRAQQKTNQEEDDFVPEGPTYISHNLPLTLDGEYSSEVGKVQAKPKAKKKHEYDVEKEAAAEYDYQPSAPSGKYTDYNTGKSSSTVAQHPQAAGYYEKLTQAPTATPYQKYSFQPVTEQSVQTKYLGELISTVAPFNPSYNKVASTAAPVFEGQPSENIPSHLKDKNCRRIRKHIPDEDEHSRRKRDAMNCFVCEDPGSSAKFTQCSYAVEPEPKNDYSGVSERYSTPSQDPDGFRYKRYSGETAGVRHKRYSGDGTDPYEYIKSRSQKSYDEEEEKKYDEYKIPEFYTADDGIDKSFSEIQSEAITNNPANCHKEESEGMTCTICKDPKTGGNFEQCSYTSEPKAQKYAFVTEKKYDSDEPEQGSETKPVVQTKEIESSIKSIKKEEIDPSKEYKALSLPSNDNSKFAKAEDFASQSNEFKPVTLPNNDNSKYGKLEDFSSETKEFKPVTLASNENAEFSKFDNFKPAEMYKANYEGHDKFKLSEQYNPDSKEDPTSKKEQYKPIEGFNTGIPGAQGPPKKLVSDDPYDIPKHFAESTIKEQKTGVRGLEPSLYGSPDSAEAEGDDADSPRSSEPYKDIDEYHFKLFPEFHHEESQQAQVVASDPSAETTRKDVEEVLAEFTQKDRSACKKAQKNGMTCYLCVDKKGIQHEECMYVSESKPQASHLAYHEVKQIKAPEGENKSGEQVPAGTEVANQQAAVEAPAVVPAQAVVPAAAAPATMEAAASEDFETRVKYNPKRSPKKNVKKVREPERSATNESPQKERDFDEEPNKKTPAEFVVGAEEGAFSAETKPVYSKRLGVKLPRYMIEKSEFEREFDEFAGTH